MKSIDESIIAFMAFKASFDEYIKTDLSESDTRSKLIDKILIDVLGWDEKDITREGHVDSGYFDYKISVPGIFMIVEAKKQYKELILPSHHKVATLNALYKENKEVIDQIRNYGLDCGVQYGVITNGSQFIISKFYNTNGKPWKDNSALLFRSLNEVEDRFVEFYENLSRYTVVNNGGFKFDLPISAVLGKSIVSSLMDSNKELVRTSLSATLAPLVDLVFGEMFTEDRDDNLEFIKYCFVENAETKKNKDEIERLFIDEAPELSNVIPIVNTQNLADAILSEITDEEISIRATHPPNPIIIIGSKGAGKTTFINHLFKFRAQPDELEDYFTVYIDFRRFFEYDPNFDPQRLAKEIIEAIYNKYESLQLHSLGVLKRIYRKEIKRNDENIWQWDKANNEEAYNHKLSAFLEHAQSDVFEHLTLMSQYLIRERRKRLIVIIDNADQFNDKVQERLFVFSHSLTKSTLCGTVISLREGYYRKWQNSPPFDAYESNVYHITAPSYADILVRRLDFTINQIQSQSKTLTLRLPKGKTTALTTQYILDFIEGLKESIFSIENSALLDFVNYTTYPNMREGLRVLKTFLNSGHTKVEEYIEREKQRKEAKRTHATVPLHEFIKSIALLNRHYYKSDSSIVYNLFVPAAGSNDHFIKIYLLLDLANIVESGNATERLIKNESVIDKFLALGYKVQVINAALLSLIKASLIDTDEQISDIEWEKLPATYNMTLTLKGFYYLKQLLSKFVYLDLVFQDTPIFDEGWYTRLKAAFPESSKDGTRNVELRKQFLLDFLEYLKEMEKKQPAQIMAVYGSLVDKIDTQIRIEFEDV